VSDMVCILNHGELVAQAPIQELLAGNGQVMYRLGTHGDIQNLQPLIAGQPWVTAVKFENSNGQTEWQISVCDSKVAEEHLLGLAMSDPGVRVTSFGQSKLGLEEVFMNLVGGNSHGKQ
jgi:ABC-type uncharacterized transport system ATPase subunit